MFRRLEGRRSDEGFTLIELIVVVVILAMLAGVVGTGVMKKMQKSKLQIAKIQIAEFEGALQSFSFDIGRFPNTSEGLEALRRNPGDISSWDGPYVAKELPKDPWERPYVYRSPGTHGDFDIFSVGADGTEGNEDDICSWK